MFPVVAERLTLEVMVSPATFWAVAPRLWSKLHGTASIIGAVLLISASAAMGLPEEMPPPPPDSAAFEGCIIDSIIIDNRNVYNTSDPHYNHFVFRTANRLRFVTRPSVIRRELLLREGEPFSLRLAGETVRNLRQNYALYDAWFETRPGEPGHVIVRIVTVDLWSLRGGLRINREANVTSYHFGFEEMNLLGYHQFLSLYRYFPGDRDHYWDAAYHDLRLGGLPIRADLAYRNNPIDDVRLLRLSRPFYRLDQHLSVSGTVAATKGRRDQHRDTVRIAESYYQGDLFELALKYRFGEYAQKIGLSPWYRYRHDAISDQRILSPVDSPFVAFPHDSTYHELGFSLSFEQPVFITTERINGFDFTEDYTLGTAVSIGYSRAFQPGFRDAVFDHYTWDASLGFRRHAYQFHFAAASDFWVDSGADVRRTTTYSLRFYQNELTFLTVAARGLYRMDWRRNGSALLVVDGENGLRGHDRYTETGDRAAVVNLELRLYPGVEVLSVLTGAVLFGDVGRAWKPGEPVKIGNLHNALGVGLRIGLKNVTKNDLIRIDLIKPDRGPVQIGFGTGQYF